MKIKCTLFYDVRFGGADEAQWLRVWKALTSVSSTAQNWVWCHTSVIPAVGDGGDVEVGEA